MAKAKKQVRIGVIGIGGMGSSHARRVANGEIQGAVLTAVCDLVPATLKKFKSGQATAVIDCAADEGKEMSADLKTFTDSKKMIRSGEVDAVIIATPHYAHTTIGIDALKNGLHVLVEKPISVHKQDCEKLIAAHKGKKQIFAAMFNERTRPPYKKVKQLIEDGELGEILRTNWIITSWFRSEAYYKSGTWRATWEGEGGGVLLNQAPHNLDLFQWLCGMPKKIRAFCHLGKKHKIEVEDDVTAYLEYKNGATGVFIASTCDIPGTNRLEITGDKGKLILENNTITLLKPEVPISKFNKTTKLKFGTPEVWKIDIPARGDAGLHREIIQNFANGILNGEKIIAPAKEGLHSVELANAMLLSSLKEKTVELPLSSTEFARALKGLIKDAKKK